MDELSAIATRIEQRDGRKVERVDAPDGAWSYVRRRIGRKQAVVVKPESGGTFVVTSLRKGMCADIYTDDRATGLDADAAVETFARFVAEAPRHRD